MISTQQFPIIEFIVYLDETKHPHSSSWLEFVAKVNKSSSISQCKKIVGLELIGTLFIFPLNTLGNIHTSRDMALNGLHRWKDSLTLRLSLPDGDLAALKTDAVLSEVAQKALTNQIQEMSRAEPEQQLISFQEPMEDWRFLCETLRIRALLMTQRILNPFNSKLLPSSPYLFHPKNLLEYARDCSSRNQFSRATNIIYLLIMEKVNKQTILIQRHPPPSVLKFSSVHFIFCQNVSARWKANLSITRNEKNSLLATF